MPYERYGAVGVYVAECIFIEAEDIIRAYEEYWADRFSDSVLPYTERII